MTCELPDRDKRIDDFLMKKLSAEQAEAFEIHLFGCKDCLAELRMREQMVKIIKEERVTAVSDVARPRRAKSRINLVQTIADFFRIRPNTWVYVGVVAILLIAILVLPRFREQEGAEKYATNFSKSQRLESLVGQALRSSDLSISVASPRNDENFSSEDVWFRWQIKKGEDSVDLPLELKVLNNQEEIIHSVQVEGQEYRLQERPAPGLYYWILEYQGETLYLGKFFFRLPNK